MGTFNSTGSGGSWTDDSTWAETGQPAADGTDYVIITSGDVVTLPANTGTGAISIQGEITGNGHTLTLAGSGDSPLMNFDGTITSSSVLNLTITADENNTIDCLGTGTFNNVIINNSGYTTTLSHTLTCASLTITAGTLDTGSNKTLTVTGRCFVTGTLTGNTSAISVGNMKLADESTLTSAGTISVVGPHDAGWLWYNAETDGTAFAPTAGTVHFNHSSNINGKHIQESKFYNLSITGGDSGDDLTWRDATGNLLTIAGDLAVTNAQFQRNTITDTLTVTGNVTLATTAILGGNSAASGPNNFGSLTIAAGTTYKATSGTTTMTGVSDGAFNFTNAGTFTHNNGTVKFFTDSTSMEMWMNNNLTFYNVEIDTADNVRYQNTTILGDLTVTDGAFYQYSDSNTFTVHGNTHVLADGALGSSAQTGAVTYHGLITNSGTFLTGSGTNNFNGGVRNLGTFTSDDTFSIEGTGGILEGNLDDANVNVNLDAVLD